ncbi:MAG TPA: putative ABC exporter domain-containing protein [Candidatus Limnocylindria bacterium]|nr:putative ABC exporter domain-containing protein [Candidatus Limnocylindria bacterium]
MSELRALAFADVRSLVNGIAAIRRRPWRALLWTLWIAAILGLAWSRTTRHGPPARLHLGELAAQDFWICMTTAGFGIVLAFGAPHLTGFFASRAEALMLVRAPLPPSVVVGYLQLRTVGVALAQSFGRFAYIVLIAVPVQTGVPGLAREMLLLGAATLAIVSVLLPRALARGPWRTSCILAGTAIVALSVLPLLRDGLLLLVRTPAASALAERLPAWHPGLVFESVARGNLTPIGGAALVALVVGVAFAISARDAYPELYAISLARLEYRARLRGRTHPMFNVGARTRSAVHVPAALSGTLALVWLDTQTWSRRSSPVTTAVLAALSLSVGAGLALLLRTQESEVATTVVFVVLGNLMIAFASAAGVRLASDLRRPLFWLGGATLLGRLGAWTYASLWRDTILVLLVACGYVAVAHRWPTALVLVVVALGLLILTRAVGIAIFALLPGPLDQRGPAVALRLLVAYALVAPAVVPAIVIALLTRSTPAGALAGLLVGVAEAVVLLTFAAWRLAGRVDRLTTPA